MGKATFDTETMSRQVTPTATRRSFVKATTLTGVAALAAAAGGGSLFGCAKEEAPQEPAVGGADAETDAPVSAAAAPAQAYVPEEGEVKWGTCTHWGCGSGYCPMRFHVKDNTITYVESDNTGTPEFGGTQARACLRGRSIRRWLNHPDRLTSPMKRVGKRGEGKFEEISWDEAIDLFYSELKRVIDTYGNEAVYSAFSSTVEERPFERLCGFIGGRLGHYGTDSLGQLMLSICHMYGYTGLFGSALSEAANSDLVVMFGNDPATTRMSGGSGCYDLARVREAGARIVNIDYRLNESSSGHPEEWLPIRSGTDGALASAIAYVLITEGFVDEGFVNKYSIGYDETTMPEGMPEHSSYKDYILGTGYDMVPKTPEWASPITQIPVEKITELARAIGNAKAAFIVQGWGPQRHSNGENANRAIAALTLISGHIGRAGTNNGMREPYRSGSLPSNIIVPSVPNPVEASISMISMVDAIDHGETMTAVADGVQGKDKLDVGIKFLVCDATNILNQRGDFNRTHDVLCDESKCEFIVVNDLFLSPTARYADLLFPDITKHERTAVSNTVSAGDFGGYIVNEKVVDPSFQRRSFYDVCTEVADRFGVKDQFTEGHSLDEWQRVIWENTQESAPSLPSFDEALKQGVIREETPYPPAFQAYFDDPETNRLLTPSGKIELFSTTIYGIANAWEVGEKDVISPIPVYDPGFESYEDLCEEFPLYLSGWHPKNRIHSTFANIDVLDQSTRHQLWINPIDAKTRGIQTGDQVKVRSPRGEVLIEARVTPRIMPGIVGMQEGTWHDADMDGDRVDKGGNINTLCSGRLSPLAKHNPSNSIIVQVEKR